MKRAAATGLKLLVTLLLFAGLSEAAVRVQLFGTTGLTYAPMRSMQAILMSRFAIEPSLRSVTMAGSDGLLPNTSGTNYGVGFRVNNLGFRGPDTTRVPGPGVFRIAVLGGSTTMGWGVEEEEAWPSVLERRLNDGSLSWSGVPGTPPDRVEVINLAVPNTRRCLIRHLRRALYYQADLIVWKIGKNAIDDTLQKWLGRCHFESQKHRVPVVVFTAEPRPIPIDLPPNRYFRSLGSFGIDFGPEHYIYPFDPHPDGAIHRLYAERLATALAPLLPEFQRLIQLHPPDYETPWSPPVDPEPWRDPQDGFWKSYLFERVGSKLDRLGDEACAAWSEVQSLLPF